MNTKTLSIVIGIAGIAGLTGIAGCHLYNNNTNDTACAGYLGCSSHASGSIGIAPQVTVDAGVSMLHPINLGCGKDLPADQPATVPGQPKGYMHYTVMGTGATLAGNVPSKAGPRTFWVRVPVDYDSTHKYRVVYIGQGCGGYEVANTSTYQFYKESAGGTEEAIYVALDIPRDMANQDCYDNRDGPSSQEWEAFQLFHNVVDSTYCVDNDRVYISGYSTGGWLTDMWGCYFAGDGLHPWNGTPGTVPHSSGLSGTQLTSRANNISSDAGTSDAAAGSAGSTGSAGTTGSAGSTGSAGATGSAGTSGAGGDSGGGGPTDGGETDAAKFVPAPGARRFAPEYHIRAQAGVSGGEPDNNPPCNGPIAAIWVHDKTDSNAYSANHDIALPRVLKMNGCYSANPPTKPWHEDIFGVGVCVQYTDCPADYPVVFCTYNCCGHADEHEKVVPGYTTFFKELEANFKTPPVAP